jgi:hypothetical protein
LFSLELNEHPEGFYRKDVLIFKIVEQREDTDS